VRLHLEPVCADVPLMAGTRRLADIRLTRLSTSEIVGIPEVIEQWRDTFGT
jgi:hypothetical protein